MRKLKLIWDFRGPNAARIAEHHEVHLKDYIRIKKIEDTFSSIETINDMHTIAYMVIHEDKMPPIRDALKPHRGQVYMEPSK